MISKQRVFDEPKKLIRVTLLVPIKIYVVTSPQNYVVIVLVGFSQQINLQNN